MKHLLIIVFALLLSVAVIPIASADDCPADLEACEELLEDKCTKVECEEVCKDKCGWVVLVKDETFRAAVIGGIVLLIGGVAGIFITGGG